MWGRSYHLDRTLKHVHPTAFVAHTATLVGDVTIDHGTIVHGCEIGDNVLIGIRSVVLSGAHIASNCIIGACTLITEGMRVPANSLVVGTPGKVIKTVTVENEGYLRYMWEEYVSPSRAYKDARRDLDCLSPGAL